ncbi:hypothetical protein MMC07_002705 [Pseudocyphellaria aurata]|nr:hypothetical protein [Pseudocyphellaria aurata]
MRNSSNGQLRYFTQPRTYWLKLGITFLKSTISTALFDSAKQKILHATTWTSLKDWYGRMNLNTSIRGASNRETENLWDEAFRNLSEEDRRAINPQHTNKLDILKDILEAVERKNLLCLRKQWKYKKRNGEVIILRDLLEKVVVWVKKFKEVVDVAVQFDPLHAALPWAAVRFLLQLGINESQTFGSMLEGVEEVSNLISRYAILELLYLQQNPPMTAGIKDQFSISLVRLYTAVLLYLCRASQYYTQNTPARLLRAAIKISNVKDCSEKISKEEKTVDCCVQLADAEHRQVLSQGVEDIKQSVARQCKDLENILAGLREPINRSATQVSELHDSLERE